jgi:hypothetical protein
VLVGKNLNSSLGKAQEILRAIDTLRPGDRVVVLWHDACRVTNDPDVRAEYYSTPKETQGTVYDCVPDPDYPNVFYLIVCGETTAGKPDYYDAIPIAWIAKLEKLEITTIKRPKKELKSNTNLYTVKRVIVFKDAKLQSDSGGISKLPLRWIQPQGFTSRKFVEEIVKVVR